MSPCRIALPAEVNFEVPREYATFCRGHPVRVSPARAESGVLVAWDSTCLSMTSGTTIVEYDLPALKGLVVNNSEFISGAVAATVRTVLAGEDGKWVTLLILSANPASIAAFTEVVSALRACGLPVRIASSVKDLSGS